MMLPQKIFRVLLGWCRARNFDVSQIAVTTERFELHYMKQVRSLNYRMVIGICDPLKSRVRHHFN